MTEPEQTVSDQPQMRSIMDPMRELVAKLGRLPTWREIMEHDGLPIAPGPWDDESDEREVWVDETTGLDCLMRRGLMGQWCGYVGVPKGHPMYEMDREDAAELLHVHDGISYSEHCDGDTVSGVCHVPAPGAEDHVWWFGFAAMNFRDVIPASESVIRWARGRRPDNFPDLERPMFMGEPFQTYRTFAYMQAEVRSLALQLAAFDPTQSKRKRRLFQRAIVDMESL